MMKKSPKSKTWRQFKLRAMAQVSEMWGIKTWHTYRSRNNVMAPLWLACNRLSPGRPWQVYRSLCMAELRMWKGRPSKARLGSYPGDRSMEDMTEKDGYKLAQWYGKNEKEIGR